MRERFFRFLERSIRKERQTWLTQASVETPLPVVSGGLNEHALDLIVDPDYRTQPMLSYLQRVESQEHKLGFSQLGEYEAGISAIRTAIVAIDNMSLIEEVDRANSEISDKRKPLKELIRRCNEVYKTTVEGSLERAISIHKAASQYLHGGEEEREGGSVFSIVDLVNGNPGHCNDLSAAHFALRNYYRVGSRFVFGKFKGESEKGEKVAGYHAWLREEVEGREFDYDPAMYQPFVPLRIRNRSIESCSVKDEFIRRKERNV